LRAARRPVAIVSAIPGTTRDVLEAVLDIGGFPVVIADTAGLRQTSDEIEEEVVNAIDDGGSLQ
jgi:tRNA modification GTPase